MLSPFEKEELFCGGFFGKFTYLSDLYTHLGLKSMSLISRITCSSY